MPYRLRLAAEVITITRILTTPPTVLPLTALALGDKRK
jgi:hypothetical protein